MQETNQDLLQANQAVNGTGDKEINILDLSLILLSHWRLLLFGPAVAGSLALLVAFLIRPTYTAKAVVIPPQGQQSAVSAALQSLGPIAGLAGAGMNLKSPTDRYLALLASNRVADRIISAFDLDRIYDEKLREDTRKALRKKVRITAGRRDDLITIEVDDHDPKRAAAMANAFVDEFRRLLTEFAVTEAQQRRRFFEDRLAETRDRLTEAQKALQSSGISEGALRAEPKAAAETYASLRAQVTAAEVRLQSMRGFLTEQAPAVQQALTELSALRQQLARVERTNGSAGVDDYISRYREFKYYETLFELFARQYELARADESRDGLLVQLVDQAEPPQKKSRPKRALIAVSVSLFAFILTVIAILLRRAWHNAMHEPANAHKAAQLQQLWRKSGKVS